LTLPRLRPPPWDFVNAMEMQRYSPGLQVLADIPKKGVAPMPAIWHTLNWFCH
jgi:hypothetical protein